MKVKYAIDQIKGNLVTDYTFTGIWYIEDYYPYIPPLKVTLSPRMWIQIEVDDEKMFKQEQQFKEVNVCEKSIHFYTWEK